MNRIQITSNQDYPINYRTASETGYVIGCQQLLQNLSQYIPKIILDPRAQTDPSGLLFTRDHGIRRLDGSLLIPYSFQSSELEPQFRALQPRTLNGKRFVDSIKTGFGTGFDPTHREHVLKWAASINQPTRLSTATIEGGNCYIFKDSQQRPSALIGQNSLLLTLLAMEEQQLFQSIKTVHNETPSEHAFQMARNRNLLQTSLPLNRELTKIQKDIQILFNKDASSNINKINELQAKQQALQNELIVQKMMPSQLNERFQSEVSPQEKLTLLEDAKTFEAKIFLAKETISSELDIPLNRIAFLAQSRFHIDMEVFPGPKDTVFIHSELLSQNVTQRDASLQKYHKESMNRITANQAAIEANREELIKLGLKPILVPGIYEAPGKPTINFMNGLFVRPDLFLTNDPIKAYWAKETFKEITRPHFTVEFIGDGILETILTNNAAGLRCLTREF